MEPIVVIPAPGSSDAYVELSKTKAYRGHHWRKHILTLGTLIHPKTGERLTLDDAWYQRLKDNFDNGVADIVQVPLADSQNKHTEDPLRNSGEVVDLVRQGDKIYVDLDVRKPEVHQGLKDGTLLGASAFLNLDYTDTRTGQKAGPTLLHSCITNRPYVLGLEPYQEVVAATASDSDGEVVVLAQEETVPTKDEMIAALKSEHGIDVQALQEAAAQQTDLTQLTNVLAQSLSNGGVPLSSSGDGSVTLSDVVGAVAELSNSNVALTGEVNSLKRKDAERTVDGYISDGRLQPKSREAAITMALSNPDGLEDWVAPADAPFIKLNNQDGISGDTETPRREVDLDAELARITADSDMSRYFTK